MGQTSLEKTTTLFGTEALKHKFDRLAEEAKNSEDIRLQELEECRALRLLLSADDAAALCGLVKGGLKALSSAGGRKRTSSNGPASSHATTSQQKKQKPRDALFPERLLFSREFRGASCLFSATCQNAFFPIAACCKEIVSIL